MRTAHLLIMKSRILLLAGAALLGAATASAAKRAAPHFGRTPIRDEVVIIGDTPADIYCGAGIGARALGVATGGYPVDALAACEPHAVFADLSDTAAVLAAILE